MQTRKGLCGSLWSTGECVVMPNQYYDYYVLLTASREVSRDEVQAEAQPGTAPENVFWSVWGACLALGRWLVMLVCPSVFNLSHAEVPGAQEIITFVWLAACDSGTSGLDLCKFHALHVAVASHRLVKDLLCVAIAIFYDFDYVLECCFCGWGSIWLISMLSSHPSLHGAAQIVSWTFPCG